MNITEIRVKLVSSNAERLRAFCSVTLDDAFVIRDLKIIDGTSGPFVAMPSRKLADRCPKCGCKNHLRARFCNDCGGHLNENRAPRDDKGRVKLHADVAHPINMGGRELIQQRVIDAYQRELESAKTPGYQPQTLDTGDDLETPAYEDLIAELKETAAQRAAERSDRQTRRTDSPPPPPLPQRRPPREEPMPAQAPVPVAAKPPPPSRPQRDAPPPPSTSPLPSPDDPFSAGIM